MEKFNCILLVDDDATTNFLNESLIEEMKISHQVLVAYNGKEGLELLDNYFRVHGTYPELILLDINMPVMDGFEFLEAYQQLNREQTAAVKIIMLTTSSSQVDIQRIKKLGVSHFLSKPLTEEMLQNIVSER